MLPHDPKRTLARIEELIVLARMSRRLKKAPVVYGCADPQLNLGWVRHWLSQRYDALAKDLEHGCEAEIRRLACQPKG
jgi:hypothetical protein